MTRHGGGVYLRQTTKPEDVAPGPAVSGTPPGFRHFGNPGTPSNIYNGATVKARRQLEQDMLWLNERMASETPAWNIPENPHDGREFICSQEPVAEDNPFIPSGYTYLLQLVAHDMVFTPVPFWAVNDLVAETRNERHIRLQLDALYGAGPPVLPIIYVPDTERDHSRAALQIGRSQPPEGQTVCPFRDIGRLRQSNTLSPVLPGVTETLVADPRNDDHAIISQLTMVWHWLHNIFVEMQPPVTNSGYKSAPDYIQNFNKRFLDAREATTLTYRHLIRTDLLPRILHPDVYAYYNDPEAKFVDAASGDPAAGLPLEFSHGAFRLGHTMVRGYQSDHYLISDGNLQSLSDALEATSSQRPNMQPIRAIWLIRWANFFNVKDVSDSSQINLSHRIGPTVASDLIGGSGDFSQPISPTGGSGINYRDLISAGLADLWPVEEIISTIGAASDWHRGILAKSPLLRERTYRTKAIRQWLVLDEDLGQRAGPAVLKRLSSNPPLPFFVLFEAMQEPDADGCRLGILGSLLVAEVLFGELNRNKLASEKFDGDLTARLCHISPSFKKVPEINTMANLVQFVAAQLKTAADEAIREPDLVTGQWAERSTSARRAHSRLYNATT